MHVGCIVTPYLCNVKSKRSYFDDAEHTAYTTFKMERLQVFGKAV